MNIKERAYQIASVNMKNKCSHAELEDFAEALVAPAAYIFKPNNELLWPHEVDQNVFASDQEDYDLLYTTPQPDRTAELEAEVMRLRDALGKLLDSHEECTDFDGFAAQIVSMDDYHEAQEALSTPFTPAALNELIEKVERMTIERTAACDLNRMVELYGNIHTAIRALPTGQIKLEELLK